MIFFEAIEEEQQCKLFTVGAGSHLLLHVNLQNNYMAPLMVQPHITAVGGDTTHIPLQKMQPLYRYLASKAQDSILFSFEIPAEWKAGEIRKFELHFGGNKEGVWSFGFEIQQGVEGVPAFYEKHISLHLPLSDKDTTQETQALSSGKYMKQLVQLFKGMEGVEKIPSRMIATELLLSVCETGYGIAQEPDKKVFIQQLKRSVFFKNGVLLVAGSQLLNWLTIGHGYAHKFAKKETGTSLFSHWESLMFQLMGTDVENEALTEEAEANQHGIGHDQLLAEIDGEPDRFFLFFVLGIMERSPKMKQKVVQLCDGIALPAAQSKELAQKMFAFVTREKGSLQR